MYSVIKNLYSKKYNLFIFTIIVLFTTIIFTIDMTISDGNKCLKNINNKRDKLIYSLVILLHHFIVYLVFIGIFFNNYKILLAILLISVIIRLHWFFLNNQCGLTLIGSKYCGNKQPVYFNDIFKLIGLKNYDVFNNIIYELFYYIIITIYIVKIYKLKMM